MHRKISRTLRKLANAIYRDFLTAVKIEKFTEKKNFAQNIHCEYMLEPPRRGEAGRL